MRWQIALALGLLVAADCARDDAVKKEMKNLEGTWSILSLEINGTMVSEEDAKKFKLETVGDKWNVTIDGNLVEATYQVDPTKDPKNIELTYAEGKFKGQPMHGIYSFVGDTLQLCRCLEPSKDRPKEFTAGADSGLVLVVWKRQQ